jgi:hypothetical protein
MGVSDEAKNVIPLKFIRKIKNNFFFPLVNSIRGHTVYRRPKNGVLTVHYGVEEITVNVRKMFKTLYWTYLLIWRSLKVALNRSIISKYRVSTTKPGHRHITHIKIIYELQ